MKMLVVDAYPLTTAAQLPVVPGTPPEVIQRDFMFAFETGKTAPGLCLRDPFPGGNFLECFPVQTGLSLRIGDVVEASVVRTKVAPQAKNADIIVGKILQIVTVNGEPVKDLRADRPVWPDDWGKDSNERIMMRGLIGALMFALGAPYQTGMKLVLIGFQNTGKSATAGQLIGSLPPEYQVVVASTGEREEEAFSFEDLAKQRKNMYVLAVSGHKMPYAQLRVAELAAQMARRMAEKPGSKVFFLLDSFTRLTFAINQIP
ncbi:MAG: hypothetical protein Q8N84_00655, partial [bacterium]|nr:hypothetical protein [bacterium]